jgi:hypothetical protein
MEARDTLSPLGRKILNEIQANRRASVSIDPEVVELHLIEGTPIPMGTVELVARLGLPMRPEED